MLIFGINPKNQLKKINYKMYQKKVQQNQKDPYINTWLIQKQNSDQKIIDWKRYSFKIHKKYITSFIFRKKRMQYNPVSFHRIHATKTRYGY